MLSYIQDRVLRKDYRAISSHHLARTYYELRMKTHSRPTIPRLRKTRTYCLRTYFIWISPELEGRLMFFPAPSDLARSIA
jgi:hypothetical protein